MYPETREPARSLLEDQNGTLEPEELFPMARMPGVLFEVFFTTKCVKEMCQAADSRCAVYSRLGHF